VEDCDDSHPRFDSSSRRGLAAPSSQRAVVEALPQRPNGCPDAPPDDLCGMSLVGLLARGMQHNARPSTTMPPRSCSTMMTTTTPRPSVTIGSHQETRGGGGRNGRQSSIAGPALQGRAFGSRTAALRRSRDSDAFLESGRRHARRSHQQRATLRAILDYALGVAGSGDDDDDDDEEGGTRFE
jgi:hypothetical protein